MYILSITLKIISLKLEDKLLEEIDDRLIKNRYSTRTEFIRDAIREKLAELEKDEILRNITTSPSSKKKDQALALLQGNAKQGKQTKQGKNKKGKTKR